MKKTKDNMKRSSRGTKCLIIICIIAAVLAAGALTAWWFLVVENIGDQVTVEAGAQTVDADAFVIRDWDIPAEIATDLETIDLNRPGDYPVQIRYLDRIYDSQLLVRDTVSPEADLRSLTTLSIQMPEPEDYVTEIRDVTAVTIQYEQEPDLSRVGDQIVTLLLTDESGNTSLWETTLTVVFDIQAPVIEGAADLTTYRGQSVDYLSGVTITDDLDEAPVLTVDDSQVDLTQGGEYRVVYTGIDASGNAAEVVTTLTVIVDDTSPSILGVNPISLYAGSTVSYRSGILVTDDIDENPSLSIDSSGVDLSLPGSYEVTYIAKDAAGNETSVTTSVTVKEKTAAYVDEETIYAEADDLLAKLVTDDMTDREKVEAVFTWIQRNCAYIGTSDKTDWLQAAHTLLTRRVGDCFNFYALNKLLLDRLGISNITVTRGDNPYRSTSHYWSLVSVDGGETYYHVDTTPHSSSSYLRFCLVTDAYLDDYDQYYYHGYYARDKSLYPATPTEELE